MIVNMTCPKCGGRSSEYDQNKWCCLECGNKFIFAPQAPQQTFVQNTVSIQGQATYDIDVSKSKPPVPKIQKRGDGQPEFFARQIAITTQEVNALQQQREQASLARKLWLVANIVWIPFIALSAFSLLDMMVHGKKEFDNLWMSAILFIVCPIGLLFFLKWRKSKLLIGSVYKAIQEQLNHISVLELEKQEDVTIGNYVLCPFCETVVEYVPLGVAHTDGLRHCLSCGRQVYTSGGFSYPVILK